MLEICLCHYWMGFLFLAAIRLRDFIARCYSNSDGFSNEFVSTSTIELISAYFIFTFPFSAIDTATSFFFDVTKLLDLRPEVF